MLSSARGEKSAAGPPCGPIVRLLGSWLLFYAGQWMFTVAAAVVAFGQSGAGGVGAVTVARLLPAVFAAPVAGSLIDRYDRRRVVALSCAALTAALAAASAIVLGSGSLSALVIVIVVASAVGTPPRPALQALLPALARSPIELTRATAGWSAVDSAGFLLGAGAGGLAIAVAGPGTVIAAAAACTAVATLLTTTLPSKAVGAGDDDAADDTPGALAGVRAVWVTRSLHAPLGLFVGLLLLEGATDVQLVALAIGRLHLGDGGPGLLYAVWGVGGLLGSGALLVIVRRAGYGRAMVLGAIAFGLLLAVSGIGGVVIAIVVMIPVGLGYSLVESAVMGVIPRLADDAVIGRVYGLCEMLYAGVAAVGALLAPLLVNGIGIAASLAAVGLGYAVCALLAARYCVQLDHGEQVAGRVRNLLHGVAFLTPLPLPQLERLVRSARPIAVAAGASVVRAGDPGDEFFVIDTGEVEIVEYGRHEGPGEGFGEIALLRDVPRTATVRAFVDTKLWAVGRSAFLAAVGAAGEVRSAADGVIAEHLARPREPARRPRPGTGR